jgi:hypothetical protein
VKNGVFSIEAKEPDRKVVYIRVFAAEDARGSPLNLAPVTVVDPFSGSGAEVWSPRDETFRLRAAKER